MQSLFACKENDLSIHVIISNHEGIKWLSNLLYLEPCNIMFKVISDITSLWYDMSNTIFIANYFLNEKKMNCSFDFYHK